MAIGDEATTAGFSIVPPNGEMGKVRRGYEEINRTRDYVAQVKKTLNERLTGTITSGTTVPSNTSGNNGDIFLKIV